MFLQLCPDIHSSLTEADDCGSQAMAKKKKKKLEEEVISEILVADINSESGAVASNVEEYFEKDEDDNEEEEEQQKKQQQASAEVTITNTGQRNHQPNCTAVCVLLAAKERAQCTSAPDWTWACAWCLVSQNIT